MFPTLAVIGSLLAWKYQVILLVSCSIDGARLGTFSLLDSLLLNAGTDSLPLSADWFSRELYGSTTKVLIVYVT